MSAYTHLHSCKREHSDTINCLAFSPDARYLASGGDDNVVVIWNVADGKTMFRLVFSTPVTSVLWHPLRTDAILCGLQNGLVYEASNFTLVSILFPTHVDYALIVRRQGMMTGSST